MDVVNRIWALPHAALPHILNYVYTTPKVINDINFIYHFNILSLDLDVSHET